MPLTKVTTNLLSGDLRDQTASNTARVILPKDTKTNLDALTRKEGNLVYDTVSKKPYYDDGSELKAIGSGSGSGGGINFITTGNADDAPTTIFTLYSACTPSLISFKVYPSIIDLL